MLVFAGIHLRVAFPVGVSRLLAAGTGENEGKACIETVSGRFLTKFGAEDLMAVRILLVDDHPVVRQGLRTLLEGRTGWEVVGEASDGTEALVKVESLQPDVVVLDITMPRMNGLDACRLIRQKKMAPGLEVLFVTQHDSPQMMGEALDAGAKGYVVKSNAARDLLDAVEAVSQHRVFTALARRQQASC